MVAEASTASADKFQRSKTRIDKLGYFSEVNLDTINVPGSPDQVDIEVKVVERPTGNLLFGVGYSTAEKVILSGSISQTNLFGTGNAVSLQINSGSSLGIDGDPEPLGPLTDLLTVAKTNRLSPVRRRARMDSVTVSHERGVCQLIGLFTRKAYTSPAADT